jgi:hypothetical protein
MAKVKSKRPTKPAKSSTKSQKKPAVKKAPPAPKAARKPAATPGWIDAGKGYALGIRDGKLVATKDGKPLGSVPKPLKDGPIGDRLDSAIDFLDDHARTCMQTVETWMLRSLPVPRGVLEAVMIDEAWAHALKDAWILPIRKAGTAERAAGGFFRGVDRTKGVGVVDRDGETTWLDTEMILIPHPTLLSELDDLRQLAVEVGISQGLSQLFRETFVRPAVPPEDPQSIPNYAGGEFAMMSQAIGLAKRIGYRVAGGASVCRVLENARFVESRYDLGEGDPMYETTTGALTWVDDKQRPIAVVDVPPIAFSEGMRMAAAIYAKRKVEKEQTDD